jgi:hypothetical protein
MTDSPNTPPRSEDFNSRYGGQVREIFATIVREDLATGGDATAQARHYAGRGKPDFALAYLMACTLTESEKQALLAEAYERRADYTEERAREFDRKFHRPFPLLFTEAAKDRATAQQIRAGKAGPPTAGRRLPVM